MSSSWRKQWPTSGEPPLDLVADIQKQKRGAPSAGSTGHAADPDQGQMVGRSDLHGDRGAAHDISWEIQESESQSHTKDLNGRIMAGCNRGSRSLYVTQTWPCKTSLPCHGGAGDRLGFLESQGDGHMCGRIIKALIEPIICLDRPKCVFYNLKTQASPGLDRDACSCQGCLGLASRQAQKHKGSQGG